MNQSSFIEENKIDNISFDTNVLIGLVLNPNNMQRVNLVLHGDKFIDRLDEKITTKLSELVIGETKNVLGKLDEDQKKLDDFIKTYKIEIILLDKIDKSLARTLIEKMDTKYFQKKAQQLQAKYKKYGRVLDFEMSDAIIVANLFRGEVKFVFSNDPAFRLLAKAARIISTDLMMSLNPKILRFLP